MAGRMAHIQIAGLLILWTAIFVTGLYFIAEGLLCSSERSLNLLIAGMTVATTGGYPLWKDFVAPILPR
jgi:hypothetical protein